MPTVTPPTTSTALQPVRGEAPHSALLPGDQISQRLAAYPDADRDLLMWLYHHMRKHDLSYAQVAELLRKPDGSPYSEDSVYHLLTGRRGTEIPRPLMVAIEKFRERDEAEQEARRAPFIETSLTKRIFQYCEAAISHHRIGWIYGDSQIGKSEALEEFQRRNNHGRTIYVRVPSKGYLSDFIAQLADQCGIGRILKLARARARIIDYFQANHLLIVDEAHASFTPIERASSYDIIEFVREIFDAKKCGVVFCATKVLRDMFDRHGTHRAIAKQARRRGLPPLELESIPLRRDLDKFSAHYGLPKPTGNALDLQTEVIAYEGLGQWLTFLNAGAKLAAKLEEPLTWSHVQRAHASFLRLGQPPTEDGGAK